MMKGKQKVSDSSINEIGDYSDVLLTAINDLVEDNFRWVLESATDIHIYRDQFFLTLCRKKKILITFVVEAIQSWRLKTLKEFD